MLEAPSVHLAEEKINLEKFKKIVIRKNGEYIVFLAS